MEATTTQPGIEIVDGYYVGCGEFQSMGSGIVVSDGKPLGVFTRGWRGYFSDREFYWLACIFDSGHTMDHTAHCWPSVSLAPDCESHYLHERFTSKEAAIAAIACEFGIAPVDEPADDCFGHDGSGPGPVRTIGSRMGLL